MQALRAPFTFIFLWLSSMLWHLWRIGTGRPYYKGMADSVFTALSFMLVYVLAGLLRWVLLEQGEWPKVAGELLIGFVIDMLIASRRQLSDASVFALLGASAVVDMLAVAATLAGLIDEPKGWGFVALELALSVCCLYRFKLEDPLVRQSGYRRTKSGELAQKT
jgi:hypothetical protein